MRKINKVGLYITIVIAIFYHNILTARPSSTDCVPQISYTKMSGAYTAKLGLPFTTLEGELQKMASENPDYCQMEVAINFLSPFDSKWLVFKTQKMTNDGLGNHLQVKYIAPAYQVLIRNANGDTLHDLTFGGELEQDIFTTQNIQSSEKELYDLWQSKRFTVYENAENQSNRYSEFIEWIESTRLDNDANELVEEVEPVSVVEPEEEELVEVDSSNDPSISPVSSTSTISDDLNEKTKQLQDPNPDLYEPEDLTKPLTLDQEKVASYKFETLRDLVSFAFCSKYSYAVMNESWFSIDVEVGNLTNGSTDYFTLNLRDTLFNANNLDEDSWFRIHYTKENLDKDIAKYEQRLDAIYKEQKIIEFGAHFGKKFIQSMPNFETRNRYSYGRDEWISEEIDNRFDKAMFSLMVTGLEGMAIENSKKEVNYYLKKIVVATDLYHFYKRMKEVGLPKYMLKESRGFTMDYPKKMTPTFSFRGSLFAVVADEVTFNDYLTTDALSSRLTIQIGLPYEKLDGPEDLRTMAFLRPYLVLGYENLSLGLKDDVGVFVGEEYIVNSLPGAEYKLATNEKINIKDESIQLGLAIKWVTSWHLYIELGGGITRRFRSTLQLDNDVKYFADPTTALNQTKIRSVLKKKSTKPYLNLTIGRNMNFKGRSTLGCMGKMNGFEIFLTGHLARVNFKEGANYKLYQNAYNNENTAAPFVPLAGNRKFYVYFGLGIGANIM